MTRLFSSDKWKLALGFSQNIANTDRASRLQDLVQNLLHPTQPEKVIEHYTKARSFARSLVYPALGMNLYMLFTGELVLFDLKILENVLSENRELYEKIKGLMTVP